MTKEFFRSLPAAFRLEREIKNLGKEADLNKLLSILDQGCLPAIGNKNIRFRLTALVIEAAQENLSCGKGYKNLAEGFGLTLKFLPHFVSVFSFDTEGAIIRTANLISIINFPQTVNSFINEVASQKERISIDPTVPSLTQIEEAIKILTECSQNPSLKSASLFDETCETYRQWLKDHLSTLQRLEKEIKRKFGLDLEKTFKSGDIIREGKASWIITTVYEGGQSIVLVVKNPLLDREEVLRLPKIPSPRLFQTANFLINLRKDLPSNLTLFFPEIYGVLVDNDDRYFLRMQKIDAVDTEKLVKKQRPKRLTQKQVIEILKISLPLLSFLHLQYPKPKGPVVLRDIKPTNMMVTLDQKGSVTAVYFPDWDTATRQGTYFDKDSAMGTEVYAAPEQLFNPRTRSYSVVPESDVYALGITLAQWLTGIEPQGSNYTGTFEQRFPELIAMVQKGELDKEWLDLVEGCTHLNTAAQNPNLPYRWSITDVKNWLQKYFPSK